MVLAILFKWTNKVVGGLIVTNIAKSAVGI